MQPPAAAIFDHVHGAQGKMGGALTLGRQCVYPECTVAVSVDVTNGPKKLAVLPGQAQISLFEGCNDK